MTNPERMVLISGMPEPEARYMVLPVTGGLVTASGPWSWSSCLGAVAGKVDFVSIVSEELMMPNANAKAT